MTDPVNSFRVSLTYQGNQPQVNPADLANLGIDPIAASTPADKVLDLSDSKLLATELSQQDLNNVKSIKVGSTYLSIPDAAVLKTLVEQLKSVCLDTKGKLRTDFQYIDFASRVNPAAKAEAVTTSLVLNVVGPEPNDGYVNTSQRDLIGGVHLIQPGDNLVNIARLLYGGSEGDVLANAQRLANFNHFADPNKIPAGKTLYLIDADFLKTISSKPPAVSTEPSVIDEVVGGEAGGQAGGTSVEDLHGAEHFTEQPATVNGLLRFIGKDVFGLITNYEHSVPKMYWDGGARGKGYPTIGVGHLIKPGEKFEGKALMSATLSDKEVEKLFLTDLKEHIEPLVEHLKPEVLKELNRNQLIALASLAFNIGPGGIDRKGRKLGFKYSPVVTALNGPGTLEERMEKAATGFSRHIYSKGKRLQGLVSRRLGERTLFLRPDAKPMDIPGYDKPKLKAFIDGLNQDDCYGDVSYADMWPSSRPKPKKK